MSVAGYVTLGNISCNLCRNKIARQVAREIAKFNSALKAWLHGEFQPGLKFRSARWGEIETFRSDNYYDYDYDYEIRTWEAGNRL